MTIIGVKKLKTVIDTAVAEVGITDVHTHLYAPCFGDMLLWGVDELLTYHYLVAEVFRWIDMPYKNFWDMSKKEQADLIWKKLFLDNSPYSEACRGVLTVLNRLGLDMGNRDLDAYRRYFSEKTMEEYVDHVFELSRVREVVMTNDPFDHNERKVWFGSYRSDPRFKAALRIDPLLNAWDRVWTNLKKWGYDVEEELNPTTLKEIRHFLSEWANRMQAVYMAVSLPPSFAFPENSSRTVILEECVLPVCREFNIPLAMMIGVKKLVNPGLGLAGDSVGKSSIETVEYLCANYPYNKFMVTMLSRENQHELCVVARKFRNLMIFGCWWFLNNPSLIEEMSRMRFELLGVSVIPQHSDARVLDQLIYKWAHSRRIIADVLFDKYKDLLETGWKLEESEIRRDVQKLFSQNFWDFVNKRL